MKLDFLKEFDFFTGVPDSQLKPLCNYLMDTYGISHHHIIAANEGNAVGIAAGYYLSTKRIPVVYLQNSGLGNIINPVASLLNNGVYGIPCLFLIGWRGEPGVYDEPQHFFQGQITLKLLEDLDIAYFCIDKDTTQEQLAEKLHEFRLMLAAGRQVAFVFKKGALEYDKKILYQNDNLLVREDIIRLITQYSEQDIVVSTTGKTSRELFEIRENTNTTHKYDFLTVGSMGHSSSIALGVAINVPHKKVWCIDGDGAVLMHMGSLALMGASKIQNIVHIVINNSAHESVGGMPTVADKINFAKIAEGCGYRSVYSVQDLGALENSLKEVKTENQLSFIEVKCAIGSRGNLGRPTITPKINRDNFMNCVQE